LFYQPLSARRAFTVVLALGVLLTTMVAAAPSASAAVAFSVSPDFPTTVSSGQTNVPASLVLVNNSTLVEAIGEINVTSLRMVPACSKQADPGCDDPGSVADPGAFVLSPTGTGRAGTGCANQVFDITTISPATGEVDFAPINQGLFLLQQPLLSADLHRCTIDFTFSVVRIPNHDAVAGAQGVQTAQVARVEGAHWLLGSPGQASGADLTTVTPPPASGPALADFNGDGRTDVGVWRPSTSQWFLKDQFARSWGLPGDIPVAGDYNGNGTTDVAVFRAHSGQWFVADQNSTYWGLSGDIPVPADYDGNGTTDIAVWRPSTGQWFLLGQPGVSWGVTGDIPVPADYDGNGTADIAVWRPSTGQWYVRNQVTVSWGVNGDVPVPADYDGNGTMDLTVWRPSNGAWYTFNGPTVSWGLPGDIPVPGDYDANGATDRVVYRNGQWFFQTNAPTIAYGLNGDVPTPLPPALYMRLFKQGG
jgi:hypothetical protein